MARPLRSALAAFALAGLAWAATAAGQAAPGTPADKTPSPWNTGTTRAAPDPPSTDSALSLRIYEDQPGYDRIPYRSGRPRRDDSAWAVDVSAVMTRCPDGNLVITALVIGGQLTPLDNRCGDERRPKTPAPGTAPQCDAKTWNCTTKPAS